MAAGVGIAPTLFGLQPNVQTDYTIQRVESSKLQVPNAISAIGVWDLEFLWNLELGT